MEMGSKEEKIETSNEIIHSLKSIEVYINNTKDALQTKVNF